MASSAALQVAFQLVLRVERCRAALPAADEWTPPDRPMRRSSSTARASDAAKRLICWSRSASMRERGRRALGDFRAGHGEIALQVLRAEHEPRTGVSRDPSDVSPAPRSAASFVRERAVRMGKAMHRARLAFATGRIPLAREALDRARAFR